MGLVDFGNILKFIRGGEPTPEEKKQLFKEAALMALARATSADTNIHHLEVEAVQQILKRVTGEEVSVADVRVAAGSELFEKQPLEKYLSGVGRKLEAGDRMTIMHSLAEVIRSDERVSRFETDYFDMVANALKVTPSEIMGLVVEAPQPLVRQ
jgi:uncharacterized tellurite resistance protein B-like protein